MKLLFFIFIVIPFGLAWCHGFVHDQKLNETYSLWAVDVREDMTLGYEDEEYGGIGLVGPTVFEYFYDGEYIFVKQKHTQYSNKYFEGIRYYLTPATIKKGEWAEKLLIGPLNKQEFENKIKTLGYSADVEFKVVVDDCFWLGLFCKS